MKKKQKVSIIIPVYNGANYIKYAIDSALSQDYKNIEIIVINDGSNDTTEEICLRYGSKIRYYRQENGGVSSALNLGIKKMEGDYFSWLSHDDLYEKEKISEQITEINKYDSKTILFSNYSLINENGKEIEQVIFDSDKIIEHHEKALLNGMINGITLLIPRKAFEDAGYFDIDLKCSQDYDLWFRMLLNGYHFHHIARILAKSRIHDNQSSNTSPLMNKEGNDLWIKIVKNYPLQDKIRVFGNDYNFYKEMTLFLSSQPYKKAAKYCLSCCKNMDKIKSKELEKELKMNKVHKNYNPLYLLKKLMNSLKNKGIKNTIRTIKKFVLGE